MSTYKFTTIVVSENHRKEYTDLREKLETTDKNLFAAIWKVARNKIPEISKIISDSKNAMLKEREKVLQEKAALKASLKKAAQEKKAEPKKVAKKKAAPKTKAIEPETEVVNG